MIQLSRPFLHSSFPTISIIRASWALLLPFSESSMPFHPLQRDLSFSAFYAWKNLSIISCIVITLVNLVKFSLRQNWPLTYPPLLCCHRTSLTSFLNIYQKVSNYWSIHLSFKIVRPLREGSLSLLQSIWNTFANRPIHSKAIFQVIDRLMFFKQNCSWCIWWS